MLLPAPMVCTPEEAKEVACRVAEVETLFVAVCDWEKCTLLGIEHQASTSHLILPLLLNRTFDF